VQRVLLLLLLVVVLVMRREVMRPLQGVVDEQLRRRLASDAGGSGGGGGELVQVRALSEDAALVATELGAPVLKPHLQHSTHAAPRRAAGWSSLHVYNDSPATASDTAGKLYIQVN